MSTDGRSSKIENAEAYERPPEPGNLGLAIFLGSLTMLFGATLIGYVMTRVRATEWPPPGVPDVPSTLLVSTAVILVSSITAQVALRAARAERPRLLQRALLATFLLGLLFVAVQSYNWYRMAPEARAIGIRSETGSAERIDAPPEARPPGAPAAARPPLMGARNPAPRQYTFLFYTLTGLHGLHVLGGLIALGMVLVNKQAAYRRPLLHLRRVRHTVVYWHFLDLVWVVMCVVLLV